VKILETERLILSKVVNSDADFVLELLNQPSFIKYIGDRKVRTIAEAENYIETRFTKSYNDFGFGMYLVELKEETASSNGQSQIPNPKSKIGICGFVKRDTLPDVDIGFAFLAQFEGKGYAFESAVAMMNYGQKTFGFNRVVAITTEDNERSGKLLEKIGFGFESLIEMPNNEVLKLYSWENL
jgi:RimJ/RimL family protein N-acetyltransferase